MNENLSLARKKYWATVDPARRKEITSGAAKARWAKASPEERSKHSYKMLEAKNEKNK
jgi:hypothetical protein